MESYLDAQSDRKKSHNFQFFVYFSEKGQKIQRQFQVLDWQC